MLNSSPHATTPRAAMVLSGDIRRRMAHDMEKLVQEKDCATTDDLVGLGWLKEQLAIHGCAAGTLAGPMVEDRFSRFLVNPQPRKPAPPAASAVAPPDLSAGMAGGEMGFLLLGARLANQNITRLSAGMTITLDVPGPAERLLQLSHDLQEEVLGLAALNRAIARKLLTLEAKTGDQ